MATKALPVYSFNRKKKYVLCSKTLNFAVSSVRKRMVIQLLTLAQKLAHLILLSSSSKCSWNKPSLGIVWSNLYRKKLISYILYIFVYCTPCIMYRCVPCTLSYFLLHISGILLMQTFRCTVSNPFFSNF